MRIRLEIPQNAGPVYRARIGYAFRLFCAIYGHRPLMDTAEPESQDLTIRYDHPASPSSPSDEGIVWLSPGYRVRRKHEPAPPPIRYARNGVNTLLHFAPVDGQAPDWLGEIFEWASCADEYSVTELDPVGRLSFAATYMGRYSIDTRVPYAAVAMRALQLEICRVFPRAGLKHRALDGASQHLVIPSHDVDYFPVGRLRGIYRMIRNAAISCLLVNRPGLGMRQAILAARMALGGSDPLDRIAVLVEEERKRGIGASYNFLVRHAHRLDAHYTLEHPGVVETLRWLESRDMEVGIHSSFLCLNAPQSLMHELLLLHARGFFPRGGRQHWLRYTLDRLIPAAERAGLAYDMSVGWSERLGFRAGTCFAFPPYNFDKERASTFLEIPMVMMDQAFQIEHDSADRMFEQAAELLSVSRQLGWGGISLLWHPAAFGVGWLPPEVADIFWRLADRRAEWGDEWIRPLDFLDTARQWYVDVGLLPAEAPLPAGEELIGEYIEAAARADVNGLHEHHAKPPQGFVRT